MHGHGFSAQTISVWVSRFDRALPSVGGRVALHAHNCIRGGFFAIASAHSVYQSINITLSQATAY